MLYALANKLLNEADLEKIKEEMKMTKLGEMLRADFIEEGREEGRVEGRAEGEAINYTPWEERPAQRTDQEKA